MLITLLAGVFVLSVVVLTHEFGHFIVAKASGISVKTFSFGFGRKLLKKKLGETEYALSALPFGGYVKFAGETAEEAEQKRKEGGEVPDSEIDPLRYFRNKRPLIRSAVVIAGPFMNYVLAVLIYVGVYYVQGLQVFPTTSIGQVKAGSPADSAGLKRGDQILEVDGGRVMNWGEVIDKLVQEPERAKQLKILRGQEVLEVSFKSKVEGNVVTIGFFPDIPARIGRVKRDSPAFHAGMRKGCVIEAIGDTAVTSFYDIERIIHRNPGVPLLIRWSLESREHMDTIVPERRKVLKEGSKTEFSIIGQIGIGPFYEKKAVSFPSAWKMGFVASNRMIVEILAFLKLLFSGKAGLKTLGGPILITQMAGDMARWGFYYLLYFLAFFNINLCIFNLLPILPFDGGHLFFFLYEGITKRKVKERIREILTQVGFVLIILLMVMVVMMDLSRCSGSSPGIF